MFAAEKRLTISGKACQKKSGKEVEKACVACCRVGPIGQLCEGYISPILYRCRYEKGKRDTTRILPPPTTLSPALLLHLFFSDAYTSPGPSTPASSAAAIWVVTIWVKRAQASGSPPLAATGPG